MIVLGLDLGVKTGWAVCRDGRIVESGVQEFALARGESPGFRFLRFRRFLEMFRPLELSLVSWERSHHRGGYTTELHVGFSTRVLEWAAELKVEHAPVHSATLKKWAIGGGRASKREMIEQAVKYVDRDCRIRGQKLGDDEADAILVAMWAWEQVKGGAK